MTILNRLYASGGPERIIETLEITDGTENIRLTVGWEDVTVTLEDSTSATFTAVGMELALPAKNDDGSQDLTFALSNITGQVSQFIRSHIASRTPMTIKRRIYTSDDLTAPAQSPDVFEVKGGSWDSLQASITAGYFDLLGTAWPRQLYTLDKYPGLRYFT